MVYHRINKYIRNYNEIALIGFVFTVLAVILFILARPCGGSFEGCDGAGVAYAGYTLILGFLSLIFGIVSAITIMITKKKGLLLSVVSIIIGGFILLWWL